MSGMQRFQNMNFLHTICLKEHCRIGFASKDVAGKESTLQLYVIYHKHKLTNL